MLENASLKNRSVKNEIVHRFLYAQHNKESLLKWREWYDVSVNVVTSSTPRLDPRARSPVRRWPVVFDRYIWTLIAAIWKEEKRKKTNEKENAKKKKEVGARERKRRKRNWRRRRRRNEKRKREVKERKQQERKKKYEGRSENNASYLFSPKLEQILRWYLYCWIE